MSISLCMIVKNEEENLARCLNSVKGLISEIILIDTGSTDSTISIAKKYGAKVYRRRWKDSFSEARNYSLSKATGDWILVMDADDELKPDDRGALLKLTQGTNSSTDIYSCQTLCYSGNRMDCNHILFSANIRLIRNGRGYRYQGRVHEQLVGTNGIPSVTATGIHFYHYGYLSRQIKKKEKHKRNISLIHKELTENPGNGFMLFNLGNEYFSLGKTEQAMNCYQASYQTLKPVYGYGSTLLTQMVLCCEQLGRYQEQTQYLRDGLRLYPDLTDFEYLKARIFQRKGESLKAVRSFRKCIRMGTPSPEQSSLYGVSTFKPHFQLSILYGQLGETNLALCHCRKAIRYCPSNPKAFVHMADLLQQKGCRPRQLYSRLSRLSMKDADSLLMLSDLFYDRKMFQQAVQFAKRAKKQAPKCSAARYDEGICLFFLGQYHRSYQCLSEGCFGQFAENSEFFRLLCTLLLPSSAQKCVEDFQSKLTPSDYLVAVTFRSLLKGKKIEPLSIQTEDFQEYTDSTFGLLEILLRAGLLNEYLKAVPLLNPINDSSALLRLGKLYYQYGYKKLAYHELNRFIRLTGKIDAEGLRIMQQTIDFAPK